MLLRIRTLHPILRRSLTICDWFASVRPLSLMLCSIAEFRYSPVYEAHDGRSHIIRCTSKTCHPSSIHQALGHPCGERETSYLRSDALPGSCAAHTSNSSRGLFPREHGGRRYSPSRSGSCVRLLLHGSL